MRAAKVASPPRKINTLPGWRSRDDPERMRMAEAPQDLRAELPNDTRRRGAIGRCLDELPQVAERDVHDQGRDGIAVADMKLSDARDVCMGSRR